jgi:hypothetical protein
MQQCCNPPEVSGYQARLGQDVSVQRWSTHRFLLFSRFGYRLAKAAGLDGTKFAFRLYAGKRTRISILALFYIQPNRLSRIR